MLSLLKGYRENKNQFIILAAIFYAISLFTKEDFILPNILLIAYLFLFEKKGDDINLSQRKIKLFLFLIYSVIAIVALILFNKYIVHSVFTGMSASPSAPYAVNLTLPSIFTVYSGYLISNIYAIILSIGGLLIFILSLFLPDSKIKIKLLLLILIILALVMPYSVLPNHTAYAYSYNWLPWESVLIVFGLFFLTAKWQKKSSYLFVGVMNILLMLISYPHRSYTNIKYEEAAQRNKNMVSSLIYFKKQLNQESSIGIVNATNFAAWLIGNGDYFRNNLELTPKWIVFVDNYSTDTHQLDLNKYINIVNTKKICDFSSMKYLFFSPNGNGKLSNNCHGN